MKYYIIAGEASGDLHGSNLMKAIQQVDVDAQFRFWGGDRMAKVAGSPVKHIKDLAFMGFVEVVQHLGTIFKNIKFCKQDIQHFQTDVLILIDYPGFNLRIAKWAKQQNLRTVYYISPQIWAWKENRIKAIKRDVDLMLCILPFEKKFYQKHGMEVSYVGHPLIAVVEQTLKEEVQVYQHSPIIALLPGSRRQEIARILPEMLSVTDEFPDHHFYIAQAPHIEIDFYEHLIGSKKQNIFIVENASNNLLRQADVALVTSGTATLEAALYQCPQVVCYKANKLSYLLARKLIKVKYISLVNLILNKEAVKELIQDDLNQQNITFELKQLLDSTERKTVLQKDYQQLWKILSEKNAAQQAAESILQLIKN